jgi:4-hydroxy-4-methyl-2-oxoglutarate aldolase
MDKEIVELIDRLAKISSPNISDAMAKLLTKKLKHQTMDAAIKPLDKAMRVCGPAFTVRAYPGATYAMENAIAEAPAGSVIVCDGQGSQAGVMMGGIMSTIAKRNGVAGAVIDGAVRDIDEVIQLGFPVFTRHVTPRSGTFDQLGDLQQIVSCGDVVVRPGDVISGDLNGVVVVPQEILPQVTAASEDLAAFEDELLKQVGLGCSMEEAAAKCQRPAIQEI